MRERFAIHAHIALRFFDETIRFARDDEAVVRHADAETLPAALQREQQRARLIGRCRGDRHRTFKRCNGLAECLRQRNALGDASRDERRNHFGVGRDRLSEPQFMACPQVGMVVDVAVQRRDEVRGVDLVLQLFAVDRMGVGFGDDSDARPTRVTEHRDSCARLAHRVPQQVVGDDRRAHHSRVVAQLADFGRRLVDERPRIARDAHRARGEEAVVVAAAHQCVDSRVIAREAVVPHHHVHAGRVATAHFKPVDRRQRLLNREVCRERAATGASPGHAVDGTGRADAIVAQRPRGVAQRSYKCAATLEHGSAGRGIGLLQPPVGVSEARVELIESHGECSDEFAVAGHEPNACITAQRGVEVAQRAGHVGQLVVGRQRTTRPAPEHPVEGRQERRRLGNLTRFWPRQHRDDAAHDYNATYSAVSRNRVRAQSVMRARLLMRAPLPAVPTARRRPERVRAWSPRP